MGSAAAQTTTAVDYSRTDRSFGPGTSLRTRGYYPDYGCLRSWSPGVTATTKSFRPEATAQARVIQELGARSAGSVTLRPPLSNAFVEQDEVQWEVGPGPDTPEASAPEVLDPNDGDIPEDEICDPAKPWRVDVVVDDPAASGIFEVRRWSSDSDVQTRVGNRLDRYVCQGDLIGLELKRDPRLNGPNFWSAAYPDTNGDIWCAWGDPDAENGAGNI
ncbi:MAG TPA: hypothetical protein VM344_04205 [Vitreimonas sp.]|nr:hypothetical protein [Vitreimonas sp.]